MGIPIGWNITREEAKEKDVLRADVRGQRSPIRRRARPHRAATRPEDVVEAWSDDDHEAWMASRTQYLEDQPRLDHSRPERLAPPPVPEVSRTEYRSNVPARTTPRLQRDETSLRRSRSRIDGYMRAHEIRALMERDRRTPALTPGFAPAAVSRPTETAEPRDARYTSRVADFSPYRRARLTRTTRSRSPRGDMPPRQASGTDGRDDLNNINESTAVALPPLRRMGRRTVADGPLPPSGLGNWAATVNGLGDRDRSFSPDDSAPWSTFHSTVVPDPVAPTAESSFASAAASASFSNSHPSSRAGSSNSAASSQTHITIPSRQHSPPPNEHFMRACDTSDEDTASDTEEEEMEELMLAPLRREFHASHRHLPQPVDTRPRRIDPSDLPRQTRYPWSVLERSRESSAYVRDFYTSNRSAVAARPRADQLDGPAEETANTAEDDALPPADFPNSPLDRELRDARSLLERLSRREDISDDFWASVGLTRSFAEPLEGLEEPEGTFDFNSFI